MAMVKCKECGTEVSDKATACPKCGAPAPKKTSGCAIIAATLFAIFIVLPLVFGSLIRDRATSGTSTPAASRAPATPKLELVNFQCSKNSAGAIVEGRVKNISGEQLDGVWVVASYYTKSGEHIGSDSSIIEYQPILPGQTSPFKSYGPRNPNYAKCSVDGFKFTIGGTIPTKMK